MQRYTWPESAIGRGTIPLAGKRPGSLHGRAVTPGGGDRNGAGDVPRSTRDVASVVGLLILLGHAWKVTLGALPASPGGAHLRDPHDGRKAAMRTVYVVRRHLPVPLDGRPNVGGGSPQVDAPPRAACGWKLLEKALLCGSVREPSRPENTQYAPLHQYVRAF